MIDYSVLIILIILGLCAGSFINAFTWRLHKQQELKSKLARHKYSILSGRSMCPSCGHQLKSKDLIPVLSWLMLRGQCRYCHKSISIQYPLIELVTTLSFILSYIYWPFAWHSEGIVYFIIWLILLINLLALLLYDVRWMLLPDKIVYPLFGLVGIQIVLTFSFYHGDLDYLVGDVLGLLVGGGVFYVLYQVSKGKWIGGGDVKLGALLGLYLGSGLMSLLMIFLASVLGSLAALPMLLSGKMHKKSLIAYGPFLIIAAFILRLFGHSIVNWLQSRGLTL